MTYKVLIADAGSVYPVVLPVLVSAGLLGFREGKQGQGIWGLTEDALLYPPSVGVRPEGMENNTAMMFDLFGGGSGTD